MQTSNFIVIGENLHCTRAYKTDGRFVRIADDGSASILYRDAQGAEASLPVPADITAGPDWAAGKVRHCGVALSLGMHGGENDRRRGNDYLRSLAMRQQRAGAAFLDVNVDEFSTDIEIRREAMRWIVNLLESVAEVPLCIDSSSAAVLRIGLEHCDRSKARPMVNSVSLERADAISIAAEFDAAVIASAAGKTGLPANTPERMANLESLMSMLEEAGIALADIYIDPLVFPVATDSENGRALLDAVSASRKRFGPQVHIVGGFSNVSFGMPCRKLINQVFTWLAVEAGADGGIVDPFQINAATLEAVDTQTDSFKLTSDLLKGDDPFGAEFIAAYREGKLEN